MDYAELKKHLDQRFDRLETLIGLAAEKDSYTTEEVAERVHRKPWTVRQWCNDGQVQATKIHGRGRQGEWRVSHQELERIRREGPSAAGTFNNHLKLSRTAS